MSGKKLLRRIFGPKRDDGQGNEDNFTIHHFYPSHGILR
jgi:hypothetical protein